MEKALKTKASYTMMENDKVLIIYGHRELEDLFTWTPRRPSRQKSFVLLTFTICLLILVFYLGALGPRLKPFDMAELLAKNRTEAYDSVASINDQLKPKRILYWNTLDGMEDMGLGFGQGIYENCPVNNCFATNNRTHVPVDDFDAIIFYAPRYSTPKDGYPSRRSPHQKYVFFALESPHNSFLDGRVNENFYNWTMTYRRDSDIHSPFGFPLRIEKGTNYAPPSLEEFRQKRPGVAWFFNDCNAKGWRRRLMYANALRQYTHVDILTTCDRICSDAYLKRAEKKYKFYLSFENSLCPDYVTDKLYRILKLNVIPIGFGVVNYSTVAPPKSVINVLDFPGPKELAEKIDQIAGSYEEYVSYFEWKKSYVISTHRQTVKYVNCQLCAMLNSPQAQRSTVYENIRGWFLQGECFI